MLNNEDPLGRQPGRTKQWMRAAKREIKSMAGECLCLHLHQLHHESTTAITITSSSSFSRSRAADGRV